MVVRFAQRAQRSMRADHVEPRGPEMLDQRPPGVAVAGACADGEGVAKGEVDRGGHPWEGSPGSEKFSAIHGVGAGCCTPLFAGACAESTEARDQSIAPARWSRSSRRWCTRRQTPTRCQSRKRFQQVMPLQPSSCGRSSQGMPVRKTNTMPANATRSGVLGRPLRDRRGGLGSSGSISAHSSSSMSCRAILSTKREACPHRGGLSNVASSASLFA